MTASGSRAARILIVDDDVDMGEIFAEILTARGYQVRIARDGEDGILRLREELPDLLILDVEMPRLDGPGVAYRMLVEDAGMQLVPAMLVSGVVGLSEVAARVGTPYCIAKPAALAPSWCSSSARSPSASRRRQSSPASARTFLRCIA